MNTHSLCCIGYITQDKVVTPKNTIYMPGGTSFYFAHAIKHLNANDFLLVTALPVPSALKTYTEKTRTNVHNVSRQKQTLSPWKV